MKVLLICYAGMSTSLLVSKLQRTAKEKKLPYTFDAIGTYDFNDYVDENQVDYILIGPQARHMESEVAQACHNKRINVPIKVIDSVHYGRLDVEAILAMLQ